MARYVIDAPTLVHVVETGIAVHDSHQLVAPNSLRSQALNLLLGAVRRGELSEREALQQHQRLTELKIRLLGDRVSRRAAWDIALERGWGSLEYAEYLAVTQLQADALVSIDSDLIAKALDIVTLAPLTALTTGPKHGS